MFSYKRRCLLGGANKATSTTQDANRWVNGKVCHAETNVRPVGQFRVGSVLERRAPAPWTISDVLSDRDWRCRAWNRDPQSRPWFARRDGISQSARQERHRYRLRRRAIDSVLFSSPADR